MSVSVLHVLVPEPPGEVGGADLHLIDLALFQAAAGGRVVIVERGSTEFAERARDAGLDVVSATGTAFGTAVRTLADQVMAHGPAIVHAHGYDADYWAAATKIRYPTAFRSRPLVCTQHGVIADTLWHKAKTALDAAAMGVGDGVITCSPLLIARMRRWCPRGLVRYIANGVASPTLAPRDQARGELITRYGVAADGPLLGYVGRFAAEKRPDRVLRAAAELHRGGTRVHVVMVGAGPLRQDLHRLSDQLGIGPHVTFTGLVRDMSVVYGALDALLLLSDTEGTPRVVIEAMLSGVPVIASAVGGLPELLDQGHCGRLVPADGVWEAVRATKDVLNGVTSAEVARRRAVEFYAIDVMGRNVGSFYDDLLDRRPAATIDTRT